MPPGKGIATVVYADRSMAQRAIQGLNGRQIGKSCFRLRWAAAEEAAAMAMDPYAAYQYWSAYQYGAYSAYPGYSSQGYYGQQQAYDGSQSATQATVQASQAPTQAVTQASTPAATSAVSAATPAQYNGSTVTKTSIANKRASRPYLFADAKKLKVEKINKAYARARRERSLQAVTALSKLNVWLPKKYLAT
mmetsp:Transcript_19489/g.36693  ORF Transcript_19489/g.36693 Transcript_19489/m.36693 type:complete len:192 (-) Transcript_19489:269-844(-)